MSVVPASMLVALCMVTSFACSEDDTAEPVSIIPIGDSLTERAGAGTYRCHLAEMLTDAGVVVDFVGGLTSSAETSTCPHDFDRDHEAVSGATIGTRAGPALESVEALQPDVALVALGANDIIGHRAPEEVADDLEGFVRDLQRVAPDMAIFVAQYPPCRSANQWCQAGWSGYQDELTPFAGLSTDRSPVVVVDMYTGFDLDWLDDSAHPGDVGDAEMAERWMDAMVDSGVLGTVDTR